MNDLDHMKQLIQLVESAEQTDMSIPDRARKIIATYSRQSGFKSPVEPDMNKLSGTPEQDLHTEIESQLVKSYTSDPKSAGYVKRKINEFLWDLKKQDPWLAKVTSGAFGYTYWPRSERVMSGPPPSEHKQKFISNLAKKDATKYLTMYLQDTNLDHPVILDR
jgi:hypothetical protein